MLFECCVDETSGESSRADSSRNRSDGVRELRKLPGVVEERVTTTRKLLFTHQVAIWLVFRVVASRFTTIGLRLRQIFDL